VFDQAIVDRAEDDRAYPVKNDAEDNAVDPNSYRVHWSDGKEPNPTVGSLPARVCDGQADYKQSTTGVVF
jgi:hypothetical protein